MGQIQGGNIWGVSNPMDRMYKNSTVPSPVKATSPNPIVYDKARLPLFEERNPHYNTSISPSDYYIYLFLGTASPIPSQNDVPITTLRLRSLLSHRPKTRMLRGRACGQHMPRLRRQRTTVRPAIGKNPPPFLASLPLSYNNPLPRGAG